MILSIEFSLPELFEKGGGFMWPLLILAFITVLIVLERLIYYTLRQYRLSRSIRDLQQGVTSSSNPLTQVGSVFVNATSDGEEHTLNVTEREASRVIRQHERGLRILALIAAISPLIGLLGTVWGMVIAFSKIAKLGETVTPADFADGIWTGLLTTVAGLLVAIPAMAMARIFEARVDRLVHDLNELTSHLRERFFSRS
ncbi:MotA/TolQ/ExbB proton channel family protein [Akkermansiaceae bacterium]|jgi:biopolymer transport protein ExbB|nr:MotA/TolQ/ExbB proton channel family protein [bacterium]MDA9830326.1 MotA/TolQ/ExbB proton channel family protein [Akkermansiaceae bacterium]MDB4370144.1 MotA/TolQ/ExbB proton channel family protein [Akkermansiaceae bacterium]MDB4384218.1 MotA/TolQ/ExbB proton channel family protein [Akkermansiaceae bacterium]MDF1711195.1 MotA/TolQ/ExbB proton channel family protein [Akkermansiaceae bacterium]